MPAERVNAKGEKISLFAWPPRSPWIAPTLVSLLVIAGACYQWLPPKNLPGALPHLVHELQARDNLWQRYWRRVWPALPSAWRDRLRSHTPIPAEFRRATAALEMGDLDADESAAALPYLANALDDPSPIVRHNALLSLTKMGSAARPALPALEQALRDPDIGAACTAMIALSAIAPDDRRVLDALLAELNRRADSDGPSLPTARRQPILERRRRTAINGLEKCAPHFPEAVQALSRAAAADPDSAVRIEARAALGRIAQPPRQIASPNRADNH